jgi:cytoskeletal protein CcmA (bactofilin family)
MAMFDKHKGDKPSSPVSEEPRVTHTAPAVSAGTHVSSTKVAMIGQGISIAGDVKADSSLKVEGRIEGRSIQCTDEVEVAECGQVIANILAKVVKISGMVSGDIGGSEKVVITRTGRVQGNIVAPRVQLEDGALFRGSIDMNPSQSAGKESPAAVKQPAGRLDAPASSQNAVQPAPVKSQPADPDSARKESGLNLKSG